jgi:hypothetical protein
MGVGAPKRRADRFVIEASDVGCRIQIGESVLKRRETRLVEHHDQVPGGRGRPLVDLLAQLGRVEAHQDYFHLVSPALHGLQGHQLCSIDVAPGR